MLYGLSDEHAIVSVVGLGRRDAGVKKDENWHEGKENVRQAVAGARPASVSIHKYIAGGVQALRAVGVGHIRVDACGHAASAAEGAALALFTYDENKRAEVRESTPTLELLG